MSRSIHADEIDRLKVQLEAALSEGNSAKDTLKAMHADKYVQLANLADMTKQRDDARQSVASLKELLLNAELSAANLRGQLERICEVERRAATPMETRSVVVPYQGNHVGYYGGDTAGYLRPRDGEKSWTNL